MKSIFPLLLTFLAIISLSHNTKAQNTDSVKAYLLEFIEPDVNFTLSYGTGSLSLKYVKQDPLALSTEEFIEEKKEEFSRTNNPLTLITIAQTYRRMNLHKESYEWQKQAVSHVELLMEKYPDSIELVESAFLIYMETGQLDLAILAAQMTSEIRRDSESLFAEALTYNYTQQFDKGSLICKLGMELYPVEARWYLMQITNEFMKKMSVYGFGTDAFTAPENRIDRSFLNEAVEKYPDSLQVELVSVLGNFFLFAYEEVLPQFYREVKKIGEVEGFSFHLAPDIKLKLAEHYKKVITLSKRKEFKNWHSVYYTLGVIHLLQSEPKKAIAQFEKAIALMKPEYRQSQNNVYEYYDNLIFCHRILGDMESAETCVIARATGEINLEPQPKYYIEHAMYRAMDGDFDKANQLLDKAIALDSFAIDAYTHKALLLMHEDQMNDVPKFLDLAQTINPNDLLLFKTVILFNILTKNTPLANNQLDQLEAYDPTDSFIGSVRYLMTTK